LEVQLKTPPIDWLDLYTAIQAAGVTDPAFHHARFHLAPMRLIRATLAKLSERDQSLANAYSLASAHVARAVYGFMGAGEGLKHSDFLPYPQLAIKAAKSAGLQGVTVETAIAFRAALKAGWIPNSAIGSFYKYLEQIEALAKDKA
jgi:hypothetical protein